MKTKLKIGLIVLLAIIIILATGFDKLIGNIIATIPKETSIPPEVYFCPEDSCEEQLVNLINNAEKSVHCAFYDLDLDLVINELKEKNVDIKLVIDESNAEEAKGLNYVDNGRAKGLMHNKFCVIDDKIISTGSFNPTEKGNSYNNNNLIIISSKYLAENYENEFNELWNKKFGSGEKVKYPVILFNNKKIENYFCPEDSCSEHVIDNLAEAKNEIYFMTFSFTHDEIGRILIDKHNEGLKIKGIFEKFGRSKYSEYYTLEENGVDVRWDEYSYFVHHKVFIIDNKTVITGSFNPTKSGDEKNDENLLIIHDEKIAREYLNEFERI